LTAVHGKVVNKRLVYICNSGYNKKHQQVLGVAFQQTWFINSWIKFDNWFEWKPIKNSILCI